MVHCHDQPSYHFYSHHHDPIFSVSSYIFEPRKDYIIKHTFNQSSTYYTSLLVNPQVNKVCCLYELQVNITCNNMYTFLLKFVLMLPKHSFSIVSSLLFLLISYSQAYLYVIHNCIIFMYLIFPHFSQYQTLDPRWRSLCKFIRS